MYASDILQPAQARAVTIADKKCYCKNMTTILLILSGILIGWLTSGPLWALVNEIRLERKQAVLDVKKGLDTLQD